MTTIYLINNALTLNNLYFPESDLKIKREKRILSIEGEKASQELALKEELQDVNKIYASNYVMALETAKYLASKLNIDINICKELGERVLGNLGDKKIRIIQELQEKDFSYKLPNGESLNDVKSRALRFLNQVLIKDKDLKIAMFTHNVLITALLLVYCEEGFNLDNKLILNYHDKAIIDGDWKGIKVIELTFLDQELLDIKNIM